ncbi:MAG: cupredoxin domain-containing protein [Candidatus Saccharibacteria bacterium]
MSDFKLPEDQKDEYQSIDAPLVGGEDSDALSNKAYAVLIVLLVLVAGSITYLASRGSAATSTSTIASAPRSAPTSTAAIVNVSKAPVAQVSVTSTGFYPASIEVVRGQAVVWVNNDSKPHQIASDPYPSDNTLASLNSENSLLANDAYTYIFDKAGVYTYHDNLNPKLEGSVVVKP